MSSELLPSRSSDSSREKREGHTTWKKHTEKHRKIDPQALKMEGHLLIGTRKPVFLYL